MLHRLLRASVMLGLILSMPLALLHARQDPRVEPPKNPAEFWSALNFELNTGNYELAQFYLKGLLAANPSDKDLVEIERSAGMAALLRLRNIPRWSADAKQDAEARKLAEQLIEKVSAALKSELNAPARIGKYIRNLSATPEERSFAIKELIRSGAAAMPSLIEALRQETDPYRRATILNIMHQLPSDTVAPLLAALDMNDQSLKLQLLGVLRARPDFYLLPNRVETNPLPTLEFLSASPRQAPEVRSTAAELIARLVNAPNGRLPDPKVELTRAADKLYRHQLAFINTQEIPIWRWENDRLVSYPASVSQAEEYLGLRWARWALEIDPSYEPAQQVFLSLATEKAMERGGLTKPLSETAPDVHDLLATVYPGALIQTLDRALAENRTAVALGLVRAMGERAEVQAARPVRGKAGVLVRALDYPDRRVQLAAADALLRLPTPAVHNAHARIVEILRRALAGDAETRIPEGKGRFLVGHFEPEMAEKMANAVRAAGFDVERVHTGKDLIRRLKEANDIDGVILDSELPYPLLPDTLASLRQDVHLGLLPVRIVYNPATPGSIMYVSNETRPVFVQVTPQMMESLNIQKEARLNRLIDGYKQTGVVRGPLTEAIVRREFAPGEVTAADGGAPPLLPAERKAQSQLAMEWLKRLAIYPSPGYDVRPAEQTIRQATNVPELAKSAVDTLSYLPGRDPQVELANVLLDGKRPEEVRIAAAEGLIRHASKHMNALSKPQLNALIGLLPTLQNPTLHARTAAAIGVLNSSVEQSGARLQRYFPPLPQPAKAAPSAAETPKQDQ